MLVPFPHHFQQMLSAFSSTYELLVAYIANSMITDQTAALEGFILLASIYESSLKCILICAVSYCGPIRGQ